MSNLKELRRITGAGVNACAKALKDTADNLEKAVSLIHERGLETAQKMSDRQTKAGIVASYIHHDHLKGAIVQLGCETDFVARMPSFLELGEGLAQHVVAMEPRFVEDMLKQQYILQQEYTVEQVLQSVSSGCKEKVELKEFSRFEVGHKSPNSAMPCGTALSPEKQIGTETRIPHVPPPPAQFLPTRIKI